MENREHVVRTTPQIQQQQQGSKMMENDSQSHNVSEIILPDNELRLAGAAGRTHINDIDARIPVRGINQRFTFAHIMTRAYKRNSFFIYDVYYGL